MVYTVDIVDNNNKKIKNYKWHMFKVIFSTEKWDRFLVYDFRAWVTNHVQTWWPYRLKRRSNITLDLLEKRLTKADETHMFKLILNAEKEDRSLVYDCRSWVTNRVQTCHPYRLKYCLLSIVLDLLEKGLTKADEDT